MNPPPFSSTAGTVTTTPQAYAATRPPMVLAVCDHLDCPPHRCKQKPPFYAAIINKKKKRK